MKDVQCKIASAINHQNSFVLSQLSRFPRTIVLTIWYQHVRALIAPFQDELQLPQLPDLDDRLPATYSKPDHQTGEPEHDIVEFIKTDLDVSRLTKVHGKLWTAGRPQHARPLQRQRMMRRDIILTETADLHLTWSSSGIFIKPLPRYIIDHTFWTEYLCQNQELHKAACGFLFSYTWLICYESDFKIAKEANLIPNISWSSWRKIAQGVRASIKMDPVDSINPRYLYGELRLDRLNWIYRLFGHSFVRGYHFEYGTYDDFFRRNFAWILIVFLYVTVVLTAMQVGLATTQLAGSSRFQAASYGFAVFSICVPLIATGVASIAFLVLFVNNLVVTLEFVKKKEREWAKSKV